MDAEVAERIAGRRSLKGLGCRQMKGYDEALPVFGVSLGAT
jgi:hypothetical protein